MGQLDYVMRPKIGVPYAPDREPPAPAGTAPMSTDHQPHPGRQRFAWNEDQTSPTYKVRAGERLDVLLPLPWNTSADAATLTARSSSPLVRLGNVPATLSPSSSAAGRDVTLGGLHAVIAGTAPGTHRCNVRLRAQWPDGYEARDITVLIMVEPHDQLASAVAATLPAAASVADEDARAAVAADASALDRAGTAADTADPGELTDERQRLGIALDSLNDRQQFGVTAVETDALSYKKKPPHKEIGWGDLVSLAVTLASAGVAGAVANRLGAAFTDMAQGAAEEVTMAFSGAVEQGARDAIAAWGGGGTRGDAATSVASFFMAQRELLSSAQQGFAMRKVDSAAATRRAYAEDPKGTLERLQAGRRALISEQANAASIQRSATAQAFARYLARASIGSETVEHGGARVEVTKASTVAGRQSFSGTGPRGEVGVLDLYIPWEQASGQKLVKEARLVGMGRQTVATLAGLPVSSLAMPIRIVIGRNLEDQVRITVDEVGRVTFDGNYELLVESTKHLAESAGIEQRADAVVAAVRAQSVPQVIEDDDAR